jgi:methylisocitrate lyase
MRFREQSAGEIRTRFRADLSGGRPLRFPGAFSPMVAMLIEDLGFDGVYISGSVVSADLGMPDIGLTTLSEVSQRGRAISRVTSLPSIVDIDTGFGEPMNVARTIEEIEELGLAGCHIEDQVFPKRCGHLDGKEIVDVREMQGKIRIAAEAKCDPNFILIARTDSRAVEGLDKSIDRAKAYVDAGADMIFPEAMMDAKEFETFREAINVPLLANMTEFGKSELLTYGQFEEMGYNLILYPVTAWRLAMKAVEDGLKSIKEEGTQAHLLSRMQDRKRLYEILRYEDYSRFDERIYNFRLK